MIEAKGPEFALHLLGDVDDLTRDDLRAIMRALCRAAESRGREYYLGRVLEWLMDNIPLDDSAHRCRPVLALARAIASGDNCEARRNLEDRTLAVGLTTPWKLQLQARFLLCPHSESDLEDYLRRMAFRVKGPPWWWAALRPKVAPKWLPTWDRILWEEFSLHYHADSVGKDEALQQAMLLVDYWSAQASQTAVSSAVLGELAAGRSLETVMDSTGASVGFQRDIDFTLFRRLHR